jgi:hypothetical protein
MNWADRPDLSYLLSILHPILAESSHLYFKNIAMRDHEGKEVHKSVDYALIGHVMNTVPIRYRTVPANLSERAAQVKRTFWIFACCREKFLLDIFFEVKDFCVVTNFVLNTVRMFDLDNIERSVFLLIRIRIIILIRMLSTVLNFILLTNSNFWEKIPLNISDIGSRTGIWNGITWKAIQRWNSWTSV